MGEKQIENNLQLRYICDVHNYYMSTLAQKELCMNKPIDFFNSKIFKEYERAYNVYYRKEKINKIKNENSTNN